MKMNVRSLIQTVSVLVLFLVPQIGSAIVLDLDRLLVGDHAYLNAVLPLFLATEELQIAGTHITGNRTIIKGSQPEKLDPKILIVNPQLSQHSLDDPTVLSIFGSGFDLYLLSQLVAANEKYHHVFRRVYINNIGLMLPIPGDLPEGLSDAQTSTFFNVTGSLLNLIALRASFKSYVDSVDRDPVANPNLYAFYWKLLPDGGRLTYKTAGIADFMKCFTSVFVSVQNWNQEDGSLGALVKNSLKKIGDFFFLKSAREFSFESGEPTSRGISDSRDLIKYQDLLIRRAGFEAIQVAFALLKDWGYTGHESAYSLLIEAKKRSGNSVPLPFVARPVARVSGPPELGAYAEELKENLWTFKQDGTPGTLFSQDWKFDKVSFGPAKLRWKDSREEALLMKVSGSTLRAILSTGRTQLGVRFEMKYSYQIPGLNQIKPLLLHFSVPIWKILRAEYLTQEEVEIEFAIDEIPPLAILNEGDLD